MAHVGQEEGLHLASFLSLLSLLLVFLKLLVSNRKLLLRKRELAANV